MAKLSSADLLDAFKEMTLLELSEFVKQFEETFDVKAAAPGRGRGGRGRWRRRPLAAEEAEEQDEFDVILKAAGDKKIQVIKEVRTPHQPGPEGGQGPGRRRAQDGPGEGQQGGAEKAKAALEGAGATVTVK